MAEILQLEFSQVPPSLTNSKKTVIKRENSHSDSYEYIYIYINIQFTI